MKKKRGGLIAGVVVAALVALGGVGYTGFVNPGFLVPGSSGEAAGEIILIGASEMQQDPFSEVPLATAVTADFVKPQAGEASTQNGAGGAVATASGGEPGLYGGSMNESYCDVAQLVEFLGKNSDKAAAWVSAVTSDPAAKLVDGRALTVDLIPAYISSLTAVVLTQDTRVTNHGFANGQPDPWQSVLQKGTSVLVDMNGVPRAQCWCGNPLAPPTPVAGTPTYTGKSWGDFDPAKVTAVDPSPQIITSFALNPVGGGSLFTRPAGSSGTVDTQPAAGTTATTQTANGVEKAQHPDSALTVVVPAGQVVEYDRSNDGVPRLKFGYTQAAADDPSFTFVGGTGYTIRDYGTGAAARDAYITSEKQVFQDPGYSAACQSISFSEQAITLGSLSGTMITRPACAADPAHPTANWGVADPVVYFAMTGPKGEAISAFAYPDGVAGVQAALSSATFS